MTTPPQRPRREEVDPEGEHPGEDEVDALLDADLAQVRAREGADGPPPEALVAAHVLGCTRCQEVLADMRGVRGMLRARAAGAPAPPPDLQARIAAAVARDAARERREAHRRRRRTAFALAASGVLVAGLGTAVALSTGQVPGGGAAGSAGSAGGAAGGGTAEDDAAGSSAPPVVMASGTDYAPGLVASQLDAAVADPSPAAGGPGGDARGGGHRDGGDAGPGAAPGAGAGADEPRVPAETDAPTTPGGLSDPARRSDCLEDLGRADAVVLVVDSARWQGEPADVLVVTTPGDEAPDDGGQGAAPGGSPLDRPVQVWVVAPGCAGGEAGVRHFEVLG